MNSQGYEAFKGRSVGGTQLQLYYLSTELAKDSEYNVTFITRSDGNEELEKVNLLEAYRNIYGPINKLTSGLKIIYQMRKADADIYFSSSSRMDVILVTIYCKLTGKKHVHRTLHERQFDKSRIIKEPITGLFNHLGIRGSDMIFTQCRDHAKKLSEWFNPNHDVITNSFPLESAEKTSGGDYVLWVGRRIKWKRPDLILDLAENFPKEDFIIISPRTSGTKKYFDKIENKADNLDNVELIERVPRDEIQQYFDEAKLFVNTSESEGFPNTFVEAGIGTTPILSYKVNPDNFITDYNCGFSCGGDYQELENRMKQLLSDQNLSESKGENCFQYVVENHSLKKNVEKIKRVFEGLIK